MARRQSGRGPGPEWPSSAGAYFAKTIPQRSHSVAPGETSAAHSGQWVSVSWTRVERRVGDMQLLRQQHYFFVTDHVPAAASLSFAFARSDQVPFALLPSKLDSSTTSASASAGGKSYLAVIFFPSNDS